MPSINKTWTTLTKNQFARLPDTESFRWLKNECRKMVANSGVTVFATHSAPGIIEHWVAIQSGAIELTASVDAWGTGQSRPAMIIRNLNIPIEMSSAELLASVLVEIMVRYLRTPGMGRMDCFAYRVPDERIIPIFVECGFYPIGMPEKGVWMILPCADVVASLEQAKPESVMDVSSGASKLLSPILSILMQAKG